MRRNIPDDLLPPITALNALMTKISHTGSRYATVSLLLSLEKIICEAGALTLITPRITFGSDWERALHPAGNSRGPASLSGSCGVADISDKHMRRRFL